MNEKIPVKVFGIGFHKTGTSSLGSALELLGYTVCGCKPQLIKSLREGDLTPSLEMARHFGAFQDFPWPILFRELDQAFPGSQFILTVRDEKSWLRSNLNHFGSRPRETLKWIYGAYHPKDNEQLYLDRYRQHNREVLDYFEDRKDDLLILDLQTGHGWEELCPFLGVPIPDESFPHKQKARYGLDKYLRPRYMRKAIRNFREKWAKQIKPL